MEKKDQQKNIKRSPVIAVMGHVDHGKSTLLDYIRKTNIVESEAGGITQHISAYEVEHKYEGEIRKITFLDTPGHAAFSHMRKRGAIVADIAVLIVSAEDGVKPQTKEAVETIQKNKVPFIVAINKIDKPNADPEKVKSDLLELGVYVEGYGGDIPFVLISAKTGDGVKELLDTISLMADLEEFIGNTEVTATGFVIESHNDPKHGISATLIIKNGSIKKGDFVVVNGAMSSTRMLRDFTGKNIDEAQFSSPIQVIGFNQLPQVGASFETYLNKKEAERAVERCKKDLKCTIKSVPDSEEIAIIPVIVRSDVLGTGEAVVEEIEKLNDKNIFFKIIKQDTGNICESDVKMALSDEKTLVLGFNVKIDDKAKRANEFDDITIKTFDIIYKLTEWLEEEKEKLRFKKMVETIQGEAKVIKIFSLTKNGGVIGCKVEAGTLTVGEPFKIFTKERKEISGGKIIEIQQAKQKVSSVSGAKTEFGMQVEAKVEFELGDIIKTYILEEK